MKQDPKPDLGPAGKAANREYWKTKVRQAQSELIEATIQQFENAIIPRDLPVTDKGTVVFHRWNSRSNT